MVRGRVALLVWALLASVGGRAAQATTLAIPAPLVERLAYGETLPTQVRVWVLSTGRHLDRPPTAQEASLLRALARAQATDDPAPFREALRSGMPWLTEMAIEGLVFGRLADGNESDLHALRHARAEDAAFVAGFLPELATLATSAPGAEDSYLGSLPGRAGEALALLARLSRVPEVRSRATEALVAGIVARADLTAVDALGWSYYDDPPRRPASPIALTPEQRAALRPVLLEAFEKGPRPGPVGLGYVVAAVDPTLAADPRVAGRLRAWEWTEALVRTGYAPAIEKARAHGRGEDPRERKAFAAFADVAAEPRDAEAVAATLASAPYFDERESSRVARTLERFGRKDLLEAQVRRDLGHPEAGHLEQTAPALLRLDPRAATWMRAALRTLPDRTRAVLLRALIDAGEEGLADRALWIAERSPEAPARSLALRALGAEAARTGADGDVERLNRLWVVYHKSLVRDREYADGPWPSVLHAFRIAGRPRPETERLLLASFHALPQDVSARSAIAETLGAIGGPASEAALNDASRYDLRAPGYFRSVRIACREAVGRIEARTGR